MSQFFCSRFSFELTINMNSKKPLIFISNDDGFQAKGLRELMKVLRPMAHLVVMAPTVGQSGKACALTFQTPVNFYEVSRDEDVEIYACNGTPADCVKLAFQELLPVAPDLVVGGINHGDNSAVNVHYSGTMGVVLEGCMKGVPSIGYSLCSHEADADFTPLFPYIESITRKVLEEGLPKGSCLNVNFPDEHPYKGVLACRQASGMWNNEWVSHQHPRKGTYYWLTGDFTPDCTGIEYDRNALSEGYVAITPIQLDMTDYSMLKQIKTWNL